jgi:hypothetical protein
MDHISSNGQVIYTPTFSNDVDEWHGPLYICSLQNPISIRDIVRFNIQLEFLYSVNDDETRFDFFLFTEDLQPIVRFYFSEVGNLYLGYNFGVQVLDRYLNSAELSPDHTNSYSLISNFSLWLSTSAGFFGDIPLSLRRFVGGLNPIQTDNKLAYFGIVPSSHEPVANIPVHIHDIQLDYVNESDLISTNPNSDTTTNNDNGLLFSLPPLDQLLLWGISIGLALVIITFSFQTLRYRKASNGES